MKKMLHNAVYYGIKTIKNLSKSLAGVQTLLINEALIIVCTFVFL